MTSPSPSPTVRTTHTRRLSRFVEGSECTNLDLLAAPSSSTSHLLLVLSQMDEFERRKHQHRSSASSVESFVSTSVANISPADIEALMLGAKEGRRVVSFGSAVSSSSGSSSTGRRKRSWSGGLRDDFKGREGSGMQNDLGSVARKWAERLKGWTVGKDS